MGASYKIELISVEEENRLHKKYERNFLYTNKASIYGCCIKLLINADYVKDRWNDNSMSG